MSAGDTEAVGMVSPENTVGVVLAGGRSSRMGYDKAALMIGGEPLLRRVVRRVGMALSEVLVVGLETLQPLVPGTRVVPDETPGRGPLGGIVTALDAVSSPSLFVVACDMPFVNPVLLRELVRIADAMPDMDVVALHTARGVEPLHAVYRAACLPAMRAQLALGKGSLQILLQQLRVHEVLTQDTAHLDPAGLSTFNANTPEAWQQALALAETGAKRDDA